MELLRYLIFFLLPFSFGFPNRNSEEQSERYLVPSEFSVLPTSEPVVDLECAENEHFSFCSALCQHNCSNWGLPIPCPIGCFSGCVCDDGYVRDNKNDCVLLEECSQNEDKEDFDDGDLIKTISYQCPENEEYSFCEAHCQSNCTTLINPVPCSDECISGCVCNAGFIRDLNGECIPAVWCLLVEVEKPEEEENEKEEDICPLEEFFKPCLEHCQRNCTNWSKPTEICLLICVHGCICDNGTEEGPYRNCVQQVMCPTSHALQNVSEEEEVKVEEVVKEEDEDFCPPNEIFSPCLAHCQRNCTNWSDPSMICLKICVPGCICDNGMVRGPYGNCIQPRKCPSSHALQSVSGDSLIDCPVDEHFDVCKAHCQKNCSNWDQEMKCTQMCVPGCVCDEGFVRGPNGKCVLTEKCSSLNRKPKKNIKKKSQNSCLEGEERSNLQSILDSNLFCTSGNGVIEVCPPTYLNGCVCKKGYIRGHDSQCIDHRLLPDANEIHFMHDITRNPVPSQINLELEINEECLDFSESNEDNIFASSTSPSEEINTQNNTNDGISTTILQETSLDKNQVMLRKSLQNWYDDDDFHGCPNRQKCFEWCKEGGSPYGSCFKNHCVCFNE